MAKSIDVFLCHASEDKKDVVRPLAKALGESGFSYWLDEHEIRWGDKVLDRISKGLSRSKFVIAVISSSSISKPYPKKEIEAVLARSLETRSRRLRVLPLLVGGAAVQKRFLRQFPLFADIRYEKWDGDPTPIIDALREVVDERVSPSGIVSCKRVRSKERKLRGEVFLIELLNQPIELKRDSSGITATVDRRNVTHCIINNEGKRRLIGDFVTPDAIASLNAEDLNIQQFLTKSTAKSRMMIRPQRLNVPLRWASGGVLSLVTFRGKEWVPLFFRDIPPYGWNISLGSTERRFDVKGRAVSDRDLEHRYPWEFISREFLEESIVLSRRPDSDDAVGLTAFRRFEEENSSLPGPSIESWKRHAALRQERDGLASPESRTISLHPVRLQDQTSLRILSMPFGRSLDADISEVSNILICFSLRDLGIEIVKVYRYELQDSDYLLDGEIDHENCLVRMPMALFSCDYLARTFLHIKNWYHYKTPHGQPPSIKVKQAPAEEEVFLFPWDVEQRLRIIRGEMHATDHEKKRFQDWYDRFRSNFLDRAGRPTLTNASRLFVPGTAKILNLYFSQAQDREPHG